MVKVLDSCSFFAPFLCSDSHLTSFITKLGLLGPDETKSSSPAMSHYSLFILMAPWFILNIQKLLQNLYFLPRVHACSRNFLKQISRRKHHITSGLRSYLYPEGPFSPQFPSLAVCNQPDIHCSELSSKNQLRSLAPAEGITSRRLLHKACLFWHALASPLWALTLAAAALSALINDCQNTGGKARAPDAAPRYLTPPLIRASAFENTKAEMGECGCAPQEGIVEMMMSGATGVGFRYDLQISRMKT